MVTRGLWNLRADGRWHRSYLPPKAALRDFPEMPSTLTKLKEIILGRDKYMFWQPVPFPTPIHRDLDYIYTIDKDSGYLSVSQRRHINGKPSPLTRRAKLEDVVQTSCLTVEELLYTVEDPAGLQSVVPTSPLWQYGELPELDIGMPTALHELQFRLFTDFVYQWRFHLDDTSIWKSSRLFNTLAIALLRIAAWDFEILHDTVPDDLPVIFSTIPSWEAPEDDAFWFHGFLVVLHHDNEVENAIQAAVTSAKQHLSRKTCNKEPVHALLVSLRHVTLVEVDSSKVRCSTSIPLIVNSSVVRCSPGFRLLACVLTSPCWKPLQSYRETWGTSLPPEILDMVLNKLTARDIVSFAQASFAVEDWYYTSIPQLGDLGVESYGFSIPCCGKRNRHDLKDGVSCTVCYKWRHLKCLRLSNKRGKYVCDDCLRDKAYDDFHRDTCGIYAFAKRMTREACDVTVDGGHPRALHLRTLKPSHLRLELRHLGNLVEIPPRLINYTVNFGGVFSGLAYGLEQR